MTNAEAVSLLMNISAYDIDNKRGMQKQEALEMAIKALEQTKAKGEWKDIYAESEGSNSWIEFTCPHCGNTFGMESGQYGWSYGEAIPWKACPMCGGLAEHKPYKAESEE